MMRVRLFRVRGLLMRPLSKFWADKRGIAAIEFAILLPLMVTLYLAVSN